MPHLLGWPLVAVAVAVAAWGLFQLRVVVSIGCGYKAKILCTALFTCGRAIDPDRADEIQADSYWILRPFRVRVDEHARSVTASLLGVRPRTAVHRDGVGTTLLADDTPLLADDTPLATLLPVASADATSAAPDRPVPRNWPRPTAGRGDRLTRAVDRAFTEPRPHRRRRTHAVVVVQDGSVIIERYGRDVRADTPLPGWSMAKSVLSALVGLLVADSRLRLTDTELSPAWRVPDPRAAIRLEDLLRMRSGLRFSEQYANPWSDVLQMLFRSGDAAGYAAGRPLAAPPGSTWSYSSGTSNIVSALVRRTVGDRHYAGWPRQMLFDRLQMRSALLEPDASGTFICSSFMVATARDWARYGQLWLDRGRCGNDQLLPEWWVDFSTTPTPQSPGGRYGAHWWLKLQPEIGGDDPAAAAIAPDAFFAIGHEAQTLTIIPSKRLVIVRMGAAIHVDAWNHAQFVADLQEAL